MRTLIGLRLAILFIIANLFISCEKQLMDDVYLSFQQNELIIEVDNNVSSFRIQLDKQLVSGQMENKYYKKHSYEDNESKLVLNKDTLKTTARPQVHFINTTDNLIDKDGKLYKDIEIIPLNIIEDVYICYTIYNRPTTAIKGLDRDGGYHVIPITKEPENLITELKVILRPKT